MSLSKFDSVFFTLKIHLTLFLVISYFVVLMNEILFRKKLVLIWETNIGWYFEHLSSLVLSFFS